MEKLVINKQNGYSVSCIKEISDDCKGIVIVVHGFSSSKECSTYQVLLGKFPSAGLGMIGIDLPGHGKEESYEETLRVEACKDSISAVEDYIKTNYPSLPIY
jgi:alpha-beta hydrolase superfamily lysophospholipase